MMGCISISTLWLHRIGPVTELYQESLQKSKEEKGALLCSWISALRVCYKIFCLAQLFQAYVFLPLVLLSLLIFIVWWGSSSGILIKHICLLCIVQLRPSGYHLQLLGDRHWGQICWRPSRHRMRVHWQGRNRALGDRFQPKKWKDGTAH